MLGLRSFAVVAHTSNDHFRRCEKRFYVSDVLVSLCLAQLFYVAAVLRPYRDNFKSIRVTRASALQPRTFTAIVALPGTCPLSS